jgi:hypothetical protein
MTNRIQHLLGDSNLRPSERFQRLMAEGKVILGLHYHQGPDGEVMITRAGFDVLTDVMVEAEPGRRQEFEAIRAAMMEQYFRAP